jgi:hypothetical protein
MHTIPMMRSSRESSDEWWKPRQVSKPRGVRTFKIRPGSVEPGFVLSCEDVIETGIPHRRLIDAIVQAVQLSRDCTGNIQILDREGKIADVLPLPERTRESRA